MSRRAFLRTLAGLDNEHFSRLTTDDYLLCQVNGQTVLRKIGPELAIPNASVGTDQLKSEVSLFDASSVASLPQLGAVADVLDTFVLADQSAAGALKRVTASQLLANGAVEDAQVSATANITRSKLQSLFVDTANDSSDSSAGSAWASHYSFSFSIPRTGTYLLLAQVTAQINVLGWNGSAVGIGWIEAKIRDFNGAEPFTESRVCAKDGYGTTSSGNTYGSGSTMLMAVCTVASTGTKTMHVRGRYNILSGSLGSGNTTFNNASAACIELA
jgi:hypothetical protein